MSSSMRYSVGGAAHEGHFALEISTRLHGQEKGSARGGEASRATRALI